MKLLNNSINSTISAKKDRSEPLQIEDLEDEDQMLVEDFCNVDDLTDAEKAERLRAIQEVF